jgi:hypothetical protein
MTVRRFRTNAIVTALFATCITALLASTVPFPVAKEGESTVWRILHDVALGGRNDHQVEVVLLSLFWLGIFATVGIFAGWAAQATLVVATAWIRSRRSP